MGFADAYMNKHANPGKLISTVPSENLRYIVIIPAYNESGLIQSLDSFLSCILPEHDIEIISLINWPENSSNKTKEENRKIYSETLEWVIDHSHKSMNFYCHEIADMPSKHAGVGLARKILMDEAVRRLNEINNNNGIIISFDADGKCKENFFQAIEEHYNSNPHISGCNTYFEHRTDDNEYGFEVQKGIHYYELHLRYYLQGLRSTTHPNVFHTLGSSFSVKAKDYCSQGGMNKRQAGEDFYFLQKLFDLGNFSECRKTAVYLSPRPSDRVPFGTGPVINQFLRDKKEIRTYDPRLFKILKHFIDHIPELFKQDNENEIIKVMPTLLQEFLKKQDFIQKLEEIRRNSSGLESFTKRFLRWFNMFRMLKFLNFAKNEYPEIPISDAAWLLAKDLNIKIQSKPDTIEMLEFYRDLERDF